jgi:hypothetical protein
MAKYNYGKSFKKNGKMMRYRYTNKRKSTKKLVKAPSKRKTYRRSR